MGDGRGAGAGGVRPGDVESVVAFTDVTGADIVLTPLADKQRPRTPYDAKFSLPYCVAAMLVHGRVGVESFIGAIADHMRRHAVFARRCRAPT